MKTKRKTVPLGSLIAQPQAFIARLILADLISKRGDGPLQRKMLVYQRRKR